MKPQLNKINITKQDRFIYQNSQDKKRNHLKPNILAVNSANEFSKNHKIWNKNVVSQLYSKMAYE